MWSIVTLVRVAMTMAGEMSAVMDMAAECAARSGCVVRMTGMPRMVSQPPHGHDHEAGRTERQAKGIWIHKVTACKIFRLQGVHSVPERVGVLYPFCKRLPQTADYPVPPACGMVRGASCGQAYGLCIQAVVLRMARRGE
jgi:hypothetical protein